MKKYNLNKDEFINQIFFNNVPTLDTRRCELSKYFSDWHKIPDFEDWNPVILTKDTIYIDHYYEPKLKILTLKNPKKIYSSFENIRNQIKSNQNQSLLNKILNNFDWKLN